MIGRANIHVRMQAQTQPWTWTGAPEAEILALNRIVDLFCQVFKGKEDQAQGAKVDGKKVTHATTIA